MAHRSPADASVGADFALSLVSNPICPFAQRVAIALLEKQVPFRQHWIDLQNLPDWFYRISPTGKVPLLKLERSGQDTTVLFESLPICEFIEETWPNPPLHPGDAIGRAKARAWMEQATPMLEDAWTLVIGTGNAAVVESLRAKLVRMAAAHSGQTFFAGDGFSFVDAVMAPFFRYFEAMPPEIVSTIQAGIPAITRWRGALLERTSVRDAVPQDFFERLAEFKNH